MERHNLLENVLLLCLVTPNPTPQTPDPRPQTQNTKHKTQNTKHKTKQTPNPEHQTPKVFFILLGLLNPLDIVLYHDQVGRDQPGPYDFFIFVGVGSIMVASMVASVLTMYADIVDAQLTTPRLVSLVWNLVSGPLLAVRPPPLSLWSKASAPPLPGRGVQLTIPRLI